MCNYIPKSWYFRSGVPELNSRSNQEIADLMKPFISSEPNLDISKLSVVKVQGSEKGNRVNLLVSGLELSFKDFRNLFLHKDAIKMFGYAADVDFGLNVHRARSSLYLDTLLEFHNNLLETIGIGVNDPISLNIPLRAPIYSVGNFRVVIQKSAGQFWSSKKPEGFLCFTPLKFVKNLTLDHSEKLVEMHFESKIQAWQFTSLLLHNEKLYESVSGNVVLKEHLTPYFDSVVNLPRSVCQDCSSPLQITSLDTNLAFVYTDCQCKKTFEGFLCPKTKQHRYTVSPTFGGGLMRFLRPSLLIYGHPLEYFLATGAACFEEYKHSERTFAQEHVTSCELLYAERVGCTPFRREYFAILEMKETQFWNLSNLQSIMSIQMTPAFAPEITFYGNLLSKCKRGDIAAGLPPLEKNKFRFQTSLKIWREDDVHEFIQPGLELKCVPVPNNSNVINFDIHSSNWIVNYITHYRQLLSGSAQLINTGKYDKKKVLSVIVNLKISEHEEFVTWNPDLENSTYVGALLYIKSKFTMDNSSGVYQLPITCRVTLIEKREHDIQLALTGFYDESWITIFEVKNLEHTSVHLKLWTENKLGADRNQLLAKESDDEDEIRYLHMGRNQWEGFEEIINDPAAFVYEYNKNMWEQNQIKLIKQIEHESFDFVKISSDYKSQFESLRLPPRDFDMAMLNCLLANRPNFLSTPPVPFVYNVNGTTTDFATLISDLRSYLNKKQLEGLDKMLASTISFLQGPPGTAKTFCTATGIIQLCLLESGTVLALSPTNSACQVLYNSINHIIKKHQVPIKVLRIMAYAKEDEVEDVDQDVNYLHNLVQQESETWPSEIRDINQAIQSNGGAAVSANNRLVLSQHVEATSTKIMQNHQILVMTVAASNDERIRDFLKLSREMGKECPLLAVDEASKIHLSEVIPVMSLYAKRFWFIGDDCQLSPFVSSDAAKRSGHGLSWMRLARMLPCYKMVATKLNQSYRMHADICKLVSTTIYEDELKPASNVYERENDAEIVQFYGNVNAILPELKSKHVAWYTYGGFQDNRNGPAIRNEAEATITCNLIKRLLSSNEIKPSRILVIAMYSDHVTLLKERFQQESLTNPKFKDVQVITVDISQGDEADIVVLNTVRSNPNGSLGFLKCVERLCVAVSRARHYLMWVGDFDFFERAGVVHPVPSTFTNAFRRLNYPIIKLE